MRIIAKRMLEDYSKPITWLVPDNGTAPDWIVGEHEHAGSAYYSRTQLRRPCGNYLPARWFQHRRIRRVCRQRPQGLK